ncbi:unnamed protein product [Strongylus vulgaris]|uniref:Uncharacterized protein n=1 Tax=Strongylus vulgaris TaxID=40348 RepID=A0A3P7LF49_STRVU|nr:unnamed protein product [Strongylus vulgaris]
MGFDRPTLTEGGVLNRTMSFPDIVMMTPVHVPRPSIAPQLPIRDIGTLSGTGYYVRRPELTRYTGARTLPRMDQAVGPYAFPEHLSARPSDDAAVFGMLPRSNYR